MQPHKPERVVHIPLDLSETAEAWPMVALCRERFRTVVTRWASSYQHQALSDAGEWVPIASAVRDGVAQVYLRMVADMLPLRPSDAVPWAHEALAEQLILLAPSSPDYFAAFSPKDCGTDGLLRVAVLRHGVYAIQNLGHSEDYWFNVVEGRSRADLSDAVFRWHDRRPDVPSTLINRLFGPLFADLPELPVDAMAMFRRKLAVRYEA